MIDLPLSILEVTAFEAGTSAAETIRGSVRLAQRADQLGFQRIWYAEHHGSPFLADFPPAVVIAHMAAVTSSIRVGSGGVLAPNHVPLSLAEQFAALAAFHPGRIDLGIGRGPGTLDEQTARALRRGAPTANDEEYGEAVAQVLGLVGEREEVPEPWLLCSSVAGTTLAAELGLPLAFAYHIRPQNAFEALERYRDRFKPSRWSDTPRVMLSVTAVCAETEAEAAHLSRPFDIARLSLLNGRGEPQLPLEEAARRVFTSEEQAILESHRLGRAQGTPEQVARALAETGGRFGADELMLVTPVHDATSRIRSFELIAGVTGPSALGAPVG
ncbi:LLM class flavin-dependent oxidoreductase [Streptomyces sp. NPDC048281]|uniref:LLM class flavin-dependent oxidoreductase n=1 Tax=Streptomyces sp. NPDC048281 TaxID=3154715 RepID=UPI00341EF83B